MQYIVTIGSFISNCKHVILSVSTEYLVLLLSPYRSDKDLSRTLQILITLDSIMR